MKRQVWHPGLNRHVVIGGCRLPRHRPVGLKLKDFIHAGVAFPTVPSSCDWTPAAASVIKNIEGNNQYGDCHDERTEVLTDRGWQKWPEYDGSSLLGTMNTDTGALEFQAPISLRRRPHKGRMAFSAHRRLDFAVTPNHRFFYQPYVIPKPYVPRAAGYTAARFGTIDTLPTRCLIPGATTAGHLGTRLDRLTIGNRTWDGTDLLRLIALVVSDGYVRHGIHEKVVSFCCFNEARREQTAEFAHRLGIRELPGRRGVWNLYDDAELAQWLRVNAYVGDTYHAAFKRIPDLVKVAARSQIEEFVRFYGDQNHDGREQFYSTSPHVADDLQELMLRIGRRASIYRQEPRTGGVNSEGVRIEGNFPLFTIDVNETSDISIVRGKRNPGIEWGEYDGEVFCATVPNSTLVTRRNGRVLISGNCVFAENAHFVAVATGNTNGLFSYSEQQTLADYSAETGFVETDPNTDQGADPIADLNYFTQHPYADGTKLAGWALVDGTNPDEVRYAINTFGNLKMWFGIPDSIVNSMPNASGFVWDVSAGAPDGQNGHCIGSFSYDVASLPAVEVVGVTAKGPAVATWGMLGVVTWAALAAWFTDAGGGGLAVRVTPDWISAKSGNTPSGLNLAALVTAFNTYFGGNLPVPVGPPPTPVPNPAPAPPGALVSLADAEGWQAAGINAQGHFLMTKGQAIDAANAGLQAHWPAAAAPVPGALWKDAQAKGIVP